MNDLTTNTILLRDGASKKNAAVDRLAPSYLQIENRSLEELIAAAQRIAKELSFFNEENIPVSTWESFLIEDANTYFKATETGKISLQKEWAKELATYVENPASFLNATERLQKLSQPHTVLFVTFLKLLNHIKGKINGLTQRHLDFYFRERLQLTPKNSVPDVVNVLIELTENVESLAVAKGTVFLAGEDEDGNELTYTATEDTIINQAEIAALKSIFVDKQILTIEDTHNTYVENPDKGLLKMFEMAVGAPNPGDSLPVFPTGMQTLYVVYTNVVSENIEAINYVQQKLFLNLADFIQVVKKHTEAINHTGINWQSSYEILENAFKTKVKETRKKELKEINETKGVDALTKEIYGYPNAGDHLPLYNNQNGSFKVVYDDLEKKNPELNKIAEDYIIEELKLDIQKFSFMTKTLINTDATESDVAMLYQLLEQSERQYRSIVIAPPFKEITTNIYAVEDLQSLTFSQYNEVQESKRFRTFGSKFEAKQILKTANIGFAISSPLLLLKQGTRKITVVLELNKIPSSEKKTISLLEKGIFKISLSGVSAWFQPKKQSLFTTSYFVEPSANKFLLSDFITHEDDEGFIYFYEPGSTTPDPVDENIGKIVINYRLQVFKITAFKKDDLGLYNTYANYIGQLKDKPKEIAFMIAEDDLKFVLNLEIELSEEEPAILANNTSNDLVIATTPTVAFVVDQEIVTAENNESDIDILKMLMAVVFTKATLNVAVEDIKNCVIQSNDNTLNIKKPFEPFGFEPEKGSSFYFTNEEISQKPIETLKMTTEWINKPKDFEDYYTNYVENFGTDKEKNIISSDSDFKANLFLHDGLSEIPIKTAIVLFPENNTIEIENVTTAIQANRPSYTYQQVNFSDEGETEVTEWQRYFRLELNPLDFQHQTYNQLLTKQALSGNYKELNLPYQPKLKNFRISYIASTNILLENGNISENNKLFHIHPFGHKEITKGESIKLIPTYQDNGSLYIGIAKLIPSQIVSILFQMAEGTANPDVEKPVLTWSYLKNNEWFTLEINAIVSDTTNGLLNTGIVKVQIPKDATLGGTLMPNELHWLKVSAAKNIAGVSDTVAIKTQVISATLSNETVANSHYETPLKEESISETLQFIPEIETIAQPYTSSQGKPTEQGAHFNTRISERLRHKNRAISMWDYEHMILENFPQVFKVKCLPSIAALGDVNITVVPDIRKCLPFNPFRPKVAADVLDKISTFITNHAPAYANITVKNPTYLKVSARCTIKFNEGYDKVFYTSKLINEIKEFLSPWAFGKIEDLKIGGTLSAGVLINFIAERPYIDFVAKLKLFQSLEEQPFLDAALLNNGENIVRPSATDMVIVSDETHVIDVVDDNDYNEDTQKGINYMMIGRDFIVRNNE